MVVRLTRGSATRKYYKNKNVRFIEKNTGEIFKTPRFLFNEMVVTYGLIKCNPLSHLCNNKLIVEMAETRLC